MRPKGFINVQLDKQDDETSSAVRATRPESLDMIARRLINLL